MPIMIDQDHVQDAESDLGWLSKFEVAEDVYIPICDRHCWELYPQYRKWFDKTLVATESNIKWGYAGTLPESYPVVLKPIANLEGMAMDTYLIKNEKELREHYRPGSAWFEEIEGPHYSIDVVVEGGHHPKMFLTSEGIPCDGFRFKYWHCNLQNQQNYETKFFSLHKHILHWLEKNVHHDFYGVINFEIIGDKIIEVQFRMSWQFLSLYGEKIVRNIIKLYEEGKWTKPAFQSFQHPEGYSVPMWFDAYKKFEIDQEKLDTILREKLHGVSEIHLDYDPKLKKSDYFNPPKSFRLGFINCDDLTHGFDIAKQIKECYT